MAKQPEVELAQARRPPEDLACGPEIVGLGTGRQVGDDEVLRCHLLTEVQDGRLPGEHFPPEDVHRRHVQTQVLGHGVQE